MFSEGQADRTRLALLGVRREFSGARRFDRDSHQVPLVMTPWIFRPKPNPRAGVRLFCLPWAGVGAGVYRPWAFELPATIDLCAVRPPGRESRLAEVPHSDLIPLAEGVAGAIRPFLDRPFAVFGHSLGSWVGFELTRCLLRELDVSPVHLFVSGRRAPRLPGRDTPMHDLPDTEFVSEMRRRYGGIPDQVLQDRGLLDLLLPGLRADVTAAETYQYSDAEPLSCPISAFGGLSDLRVDSDELDGWRAETSGPFRLERFPGGHFYVESSRSQLLRTISADLATTTSGLVPSS